MEFEQFRKKVLSKLPEANCVGHVGQNLAYYKHLTISNAVSSDVIWVNMGNNDGLVSSIYSGRKVSRKWQG